MSLLGLIGGLILVGIALYLINSFIPMDPKIKQILNIVVVVVVVLWLLAAFGILPGLSSAKVPTFR